MGSQTRLVTPASIAGVTRKEPYAWVIVNQN
jgi:hypothetical protein